MAPHFEFQVKSIRTGGVAVSADTIEEAREKAMGHAPTLASYGEPDFALTLTKSDRKLAKAKLVQDSDCQDPFDWDGGWTLYSFHRHGNGASKRGLTNDPEHFIDTDATRQSMKQRNGVVWNDDFKELAEQGFAHILSCYDHGSQHWGLQGETMQCQWDTANVAGVLIWEHKPDDMGAKTKEERTEDARRSLEERQKWLDGDCYGYIITDADTGEDIDSCWGFIGLDYARQCLKEALGDRTLIDDNDEPIEVKDIDPTYR